MNMPDGSITRVIEIIKENFWQTILFLIIMCLALLFLPQEILQKIYIDGLIIRFRPYIGLFLIALGSLVVGKIVISIYSYFYRLRIRHKARKNYEEIILGHLEKLTPDEKRILAYYIVHQTKTQKLFLEDGNVSLLSSNKIIYRASSMGNILSGFAFNINDFAYEYLKENYNLLE